MAVPDPDDVISLITTDHQELAARFAEFAGVGAELRSELFWKLTDELVRHEVAEEVVVYPTLRDLAGGALADAELSEQRHLEELLAELERVGAASEEFGAPFEELRRAALGHASHEEDAVLPALGGLSSEELVALGQRYSAAKRSAPNHPHPGVPDAPPGNRLAGPLAALVDRIRDAASA